MATTQPVIIYVTEKIYPQPGAFNLSNLFTSGRVIVWYVPLVLFLYEITLFILKLVGWCLTSRAGLD